MWHAMRVSIIDTYDMKSKFGNTNCHLRGWLISSYIVLEVNDH